MFKVQGSMFNDQWVLDIDYSHHGPLCYLGGFGNMYPLRDYSR